MKNGICPKCDRASVYEVLPRGEDGRVTIGIFNWITPTLYVCQDCGYSETYFLDSGDRVRLEDTCRKVRPAAS